MILNGMGGKKYSEQHAVNSALLMNAAQPEYLSTLVVSFPTGVARYQQGFGGEFEALGQAGLFQEMLWLLDKLELENTIFRSDHASNYLVLKGVLGKDKTRLFKPCVLRWNNRVPSGSARNGCAGSRESSQSAQFKGCDRKDFMFPKHRFRTEVHFRTTENLLHAMALCEQHGRPVVFRNIDVDDFAGRPRG